MSSKPSKTDLVFTNNSAYKGSDFASCASDIVLVKDSSSGNEAVCVPDLPCENIITVCFYFRTISGSPGTNTFISISTSIIDPSLQLKGNETIHIECYNIYQELHIRRTIQSNFLY